MRNLITLILRRNHHIVRQAGTPEEAERICQEHSTDLLVADVNLSDCRSGTDFALRLIQVQPKIKCLFISGLPVENWTERDRHNIAKIPDGSRAVLCKPIYPDSLLKSIDDLLANRESAET